ncbi:Odorant receptor 83c [Culex quinquefasciatus]|uniref:Odorant receptor n=1 Tax=Culex quinquefasciatus TaxID=7176 RepID=B0WDY6_CULQU|nr:Odorant receptor 83c [Culex quinquefasciatus]|eukprot:XP_001846920.1 Odorant receptor 83c [Culex quinquefasciatus]
MTRETSKPTTNEGSLCEFRKSFETVRKASYMIGIDTSTPERDTNIRIIGSNLFLMALYVVCLYSGWFLRADWYSLLELSVCLLLTLQGSSKMWTAIVHKVRYFELFQTTERIYERFDSDERNRPILIDVIAKMNLLIKGIVIVYVSSGLLIVVVVVLYASITRQKFLALTAFIPFVDYTTSAGYILHSMLHLSMIVICVDGYLAADVAFIITVVPIIAYGNCLQNEIRHLNLLLQTPQRNEKLITENLVRICQLHQMIVEFEQDAVEHFKFGCAVQILFQSGTLLVTIFLTYICGYLQAACIFMALFFQLTQYCALGTIVTAKKNNQMIIDIYDIEWYLLDKPQQRIVSFMLFRAQTAKDLSVGGVAPLNVVTYVKVSSSLLFCLAYFYQVC